MKNILASPSQSVSLKFWQNAMANFCCDDFAVWQARASLKLSIDIITRGPGQAAYPCTN